MILNVAPLLKQPVGTHVDYALTEEPIDPRGESAALMEVGAVTIDAKLKATHTDPGALVEGEATARVTTQCSRCLRTIESPVTTRFAEQYYATMDVVTGFDRPAPPDDAKVIGSDFRIDASDLLREEISLATPLAPLCRADCKGLCSVCGEDLNDRPHAHEDEIDERWAKLRGVLGDFHAERE